MRPVFQAAPAVVLILKFAWAKPGWFGRLARTGTFLPKRMDESFALESAATDENKQQRMVHFFVFSKLFL
ncbi:hypothetical protein CAY57_05630 [Heyndrickxia coagulans]|nr:hypothetical protein CAY57_05630 [Heyndrickxia coagulans]